MYNSIKIFPFQLTLTSVRVSWAGLLERADCADSMLVKHYKGDNTNDFSMSDPLSVTTNSYIVRDVVPLQSYTYQVELQTKVREAFTITEKAPTRQL